MIAVLVKRLHHPVVCDLDLPFESLPLAAGSSWTLGAHTPDPDSATQDALTLLASWEATRTVEEPPAVTSQPTHDKAAPGAVDL